MVLIILGQIPTYENLYPHSSSPPSAGRLQKKEKPYRIDASKITGMNENGDSTDTVDPTDWRFDDHWNDKELSLFNLGTRLLPGAWRRLTIVLPGGT